MFEFLNVSVISLGNVGALKLALADRDKTPQGGKASYRAFINLR